MGAGGLWAKQEAAGLASNPRAQRKASRIGHDGRVGGGGTGAHGGAQVHSPAPGEAQQGERAAGRAARPLRRGGGAVGEPPERAAGSGVRDCGTRQAAAPPLPASTGQLRRPSARPCPMGKPAGARGGAAAPGARGARPGARPPVLPSCPRLAWQRAALAAPPPAGGSSARRGAAAGRGAGGPAGGRAEAARPAGRSVCAARGPVTSPRACVLARRSLAASRHPGAPPGAADAPVYSDPAEVSESGGSVWSSIGEGSWGRGPPGGHPPHRTLSTPWGLCVGGMCQGGAASRMPDPGLGEGGGCPVACSVGTGGRRMGGPAIPT